MTAAPDVPITLLLVEDNATIRDAFQILLEDSGYRVVSAETGAEGLRLAETASPHLVLLDLGLPDMEGLEVARELAARTTMRTVPIIALTGRALERDQAECLAAGCSGYITKPVNTGQLLRLIPAYLEQAGRP